MVRPSVSRAWYAEYSSSPSDAGEAPDPAAGLNPKVVELYTKFVVSCRSVALVSLNTYRQSWTCIVPVQVWSSSQTLQNYPDVACVGSYARSHSPWRLDTTSLSCRHANICLTDETATSACIPGGRSSRCNSRGHSSHQRRGKKAEEQQKIECSLLRESETSAV